MFIRVHPWFRLLMCGIGGILRTDGQPIPEEWLDAIDARIAYRGPDGCGRFRDCVEIADAAAPGGKRIVEVAFVHRRLSIIDHKDGHQPMVSERGRNDSEGLVAVVFNGCIYNHRELRKELEGKGHAFVTDHSDTEVLIHGWREWRERLAEHLEGMYAFAIWDRAHSSVYLARDLFGEKPLYVRQGFADQLPSASITFCFASEPESLVQLPLSLPPNDPLPTPWAGRFGEEPSPTDGAIDDVQWTQWYLQLGYVPPGLLVIGECGEGAADVPAGGAVSYVAEHHIKQQSQRMSRCPDRSSKHAIDGIESQLEHAVARRLQADVPLSCFLSGGIDSSLVTAFAKRHKPDVKTFCVQMPDKRYNESDHAEIVASHLRTDHTTLKLEANPADDIVRLIGILGQPFADSSILPTFWVSKAAREHTKVALTGDGGDELFLGYERYMAARLLVRFRSTLAMLPVRPLLRTHPKSTWNKFARLCEMSRRFRSFGIASMEAIFSLEEIESLTQEPDYNPFLGLSIGDPLEHLREFDLENYLPGDLLRKVDTASMACGLEVRCPFLDRDLARAAIAMPIDQLMPGGQRKGLLRQIARKYLPKEIVDRPKMGFAIPIGEWFRNDDLPAKGGGMKTLLLDHLNSAEPFGPIQLNRKAVQRFIDEHMSGKRDHGQRLFTLLTLSIWARMFGKSAPPISPSATT